MICDFSARDEKLNEAIKNKANSIFLVILTFRIY